MNKREAHIISDKVVTLLKKERERQGITPYRMAMDTGLSKNSILYIERLTQKPSFYTLVIMADYLKVSLSEIIEKVE